MRSARPLRSEEGDPERDRGEGVAGVVDQVGEKRNAGKCSSIAAGGMRYSSRPIECRTSFLLVSSSMCGLGISASPEITLLVPDREGTAMTVTRVSLRCGWQSRGGRPPGAGAGRAADRGARRSPSPGTPGGAAGGGASRAPPAARCHPGCANAEPAIDRCGKPRAGLADPSRGYATARTRYWPTPTARRLRGPARGR